jgi:hypothetical protein
MGADVAPVLLQLCLWSELSLFGLGAQECRSAGGRHLKFLKFCSPSFNSISHLPAQKARAPKHEHEHEHQPSTRTKLQPSQESPGPSHAPPDPDPDPDQITSACSVRQTKQPNPNRYAPLPVHVSPILPTSSHHHHHHHPTAPALVSYLFLSLSLGCSILPLFTLDSTQSDVPLGKTTTTTSLSLPSITKHHRLSQSLPQSHVSLIRPSKQSHWLDISGEPQLTLTHLHPYLSISSHHLVDISLSLTTSALLIPCHTHQLAFSAHIPSVPMSTTARDHYAPLVHVE